MGGGIKVPGMAPLGETRAKCCALCKKLVRRGSAVAARPLARQGLPGRTLRGPPVAAAVAGREPAQRVGGRPDA